MVCMYILTLYLTHAASQHRSYETFSLCTCREDRPPTNTDGTRHRLMKLKMFVPAPYWFHIFKEGRSLETIRLITNSKLLRLYQNEQNLLFVPCCSGPASHNWLAQRSPNLSLPKHVTRSWKGASAYGGYSISDTG